ncbi:MAG: hypothetical protein H0S85_03440 [Desulfovibrionaceae bacterium]|nr:hypothetical protein [Desulfovibrionaceae bacterium]
MGNGISSPLDKESFGAAVVGTTLDFMNGSTTSTLPVTDKQTFGAAVATKTLDYLNSGSIGSGGSGGSSKSSFAGAADYGFQTDVLGAVYSGKGALANFQV